MNFAIHGRPFADKAKPYVQALLDELERNDVEVQISESYMQLLAQAQIKHSFTNTFTNRQDIKAPDYMISLGGDGTLLDSVTLVADLETPIIGVNVGRLGFLAIISPDNIAETIPMIINQQYELDRRSLLAVECEIDIFNGLNFGLNDFVITKTDTSSMIVVHSQINGEFLNTYWADGLVISTPTGSTGYSLSVGGPVVMPHCQNFVIAPISPHNLNVRPMLVEDTCVITVEVESRSKNFLVSLDSRSKVIEGRVPITIKKEKFGAQLIKISNHSFLKTLRSKLNWGLDNRTW
jgi:NAD+ kinase